MSATSKTNHPQIPASGKISFRWSKLFVNPSRLDVFPEPVMAAPRARRMTPVAKYFNHHY